MAALATAGDYAPASLYTYFPSRSALVAALQERALVHLGQVAADAAASWDLALDETPVAESIASLARLCAFSDLFLAAPVEHRQQFRLQQELLVTPGVEDVADAGTVVPVAMHVLGLPQGLLAAAATSGGLAAGPPVADPTGEPVDPSIVRTLSWVVALNGALLADALVTGLPTTGVALGDQITDALLVGWGADTEELASARTLSSQWRGTARPQRSEDA